MSEAQQDAEAGGREVLVRTFTVESQAVDGRTLHVRVVPFDEVATVADPPDFRPYQEQFMPGVFSAQERAANRIRLRTDHRAFERDGRRKPGLEGVVGRGVSLREVNGGYEAEFRFLTTPEADTARELVADGGYDGVSAEFAPIRSMRTREGVVQRVKAHLDSVALALGPAYTKAEIIALREGGSVVDEDLLPLGLDAAIVDRCRRLGIALPERLAQRAAPTADGDQKAENRIAMMIAAANNFIADEDDPADKAAMRAIVAALQKLTKTESSETT